MDYIPSSVLEQVADLVATDRALTALTALHALSAAMQRYRPTGRDLDALDALVIAAFDRAALPAAVAALRGAADSAAAEASGCA